MTAYVQLVRQNPQGQFCTFYITNLGRSSYNGIEYRYVNNTTGYSSGWRSAGVYVAYWDGSWGYTSNFDISLTPAYTYSVYTRMMVGSTWYEGDSWYEPVTFYFTPPPPPAPSDRVSMDFYSAGTNSITQRVLGTYGATHINWKVKDYRSGSTIIDTDRSVSGTPFYETFSGLTAGTEYEISANGFTYDNNYNKQYAGAKLSATMTNPATPSINNGGSSNNTITIRVSPNGRFDQIEVEMWTIDAVSLLATRTQGWNGGGSFDAVFGGLVANASYLFRARASRGSSYADYYPNPSAWGGWLTVKNEVARPSNWAWTTAQNANGHKISGATFSMLATEWNSFTARINAFRKYKGLDEATFTTASRGGTFYFYMFNEANNAISAMRSTGVSNVSSKNLVYASYFNSLMNALNGIT